MLPFEAVLFQPRLSFLRKDDEVVAVEEGVVGSSGLDCCGGVSFFTTLIFFWARGPVNLCGLYSLANSAVKKSPLVFDLGMNAYSAFAFGSDDDRNGDTLCLVCLDPAGIWIVLPVAYPAVWIDASMFEAFIELVLRMWLKLNSGCSSFRSRDEKNEVLEAVMGVLGVFVLTRRGGGVKLPLARVESCDKAAIFAAVGVLSGSKFKGGRRSGCRVFLFDAGAEGFCSESVAAPLA